MSWKINLIMHLRDFSQIFISTLTYECLKSTMRHGKCSIFHLPLIDKCVLLTKYSLFYPPSEIILVIRQARPIFNQQKSSYLISNTELVNRNLFRSKDDDVLLIN
jgi:hypothetical protein